MSVIVPLKADRPLLRACLAELARQTYAAFDVFVVPDAAFALPDPHVRVIASGPVLPNRKRQLAAEASTAEILAFIDDDAYPDPAWLAAAARHFADPGVVAVGGPAITPPSNAPAQRASGAVLASPLVTATTRFRYVAHTQRDVDALPSCNLLIRRAAFLRDVAKTVDTWPGEDMLTCMYATQNGARIVYDPAVLVYHHRRALFAPHVRQVWNYGCFRGRFMRRYTRAQTNLAHALPAAFVLAHLALLAAVMKPQLRVPVTLAAGVYALFAARSARIEARRARVAPVLVAAGIYCSHVAYGAGTIVGWLRG